VPNGVLNTRSMGRGKSSLSLWALEEDIAVVEATWSFKRARGHHDGSASMTQGKRRPVRTFKPSSERTTNSR
jgi:hypothetical protein